MSTTAPTKTKTAYLILQRTRSQSKVADNATSTMDRNEQWELVDTVTASSAESALRKANAKPDSTGPLVLVAVPTRSWKPVKVITETVTKVTLQDA